MYVISTCVDVSIVNPVLAFDAKGKDVSRAKRLIFSFVMCDVWC